MKKLILIFLSVACLSAASCGGNEAGADYSDKSYLKLWDIDLGQEGFVRTDASLHREWKGNSEYVTYTVSPEDPKELIIGAQSIEYKDMKFFMERGAFYEIEDFDINTYEVRRDTRKLTWQNEGYLYTMTAAIDGRGISDEEFSNIISPEKALILGCDGIPEGMEIRGEVWNVEMKKGGITVTVSLYLPPFNEQKPELDEEIYKKRESDGLIYYEYDRRNLVEGPNRAEIIWETDIGLIYLSGEAPFKYRYDYLDRRLDFINPELALSITQQIGATPGIMPD